MPFNYEWQVDDAYSGNVFNHGSKSDGKVTEGEYRVLFPDGRTQVLYLSASIFYLQFIVFTVFYSIYSILQYLQYLIVLCDRLLKIERDFKF